MKDRVNKKHLQNFTTASNKILQDSRLSYEAIGVFMYLWSMPDDWQVMVKQVMKHNNSSEYSVRKSLRELRDFGYMKWIRTQGYFIYDMCEDGSFHCSDIQHNEFHCSDIQHNNIYRQNNNINKTITETNTASGFSESDFLENFIQKHLGKMSESEKAGFQTFAVTQLEQVSEKLGRLLTQQECLEHCKKILNVMYPQNENPTVKDSLTVQKPKQEVEVEIIPNCIDISKWEEWKNYKKEKKQKLTKSTAEKQLQNLQKWHLEGQDPNEIIDNSISNGWQGLFPLKQEKSNQSTFNNQNRKPKLSMSESADLIRQMAQYTKEQQEKLNPEEYADPF